METAREGDLLGLSPGDMLSKSSPGAVPAAAAGLRPQPRFQEPRGCEDGEMGSNVSLDEDEEDDEEDSDDDFVKEKPEPTAPKAPAPAPPPAAKAAPKKAHGSDDDEAENVPIKKALTVNPAGVDPAMRIADETQLDKKRQKAPAAGAAHDAGIDYGVLASDIAADNMSAHIAANEDEYVAKKTKPEKVKMKPMRRPDHGMRAARPSCPADPAMMIADETPFGNLIVLKKSGEEGGMCEMKNDVLLIGRDPEKCDIEIRLPEASRMQARLTVDEYRQVWIENLSQTNPLGTLLNDERCDGQPHLLANKDIITICGRRFRFEYCNAEVDMTDDEESGEGSSDEFDEDDSSNSEDDVPLAKVLAKPTDATGNVIKPAMSSYLHFCQERRPMVTQQLKAILGAEFKQAAVMSQLGAEWKDLPDATKAKFTSMAKSDKTRYDAAFASNPANASIKRGGGTTRARKSTGPPKLSAYLHFCAEKRPAKTALLKESMGTAFKSSAVVSALGADWKVLDEASKARFKQMAEHGAGNNAESEPNRTLSAYNVFMKSEAARVKAEWPELPHREAFKMAAQNWQTSAADTGGSLASGTPRVVCALKSAPELNGTSCVVLEWVPSEGRYLVRLDMATLANGESLVKLRPECLAATYAAALAATSAAGVLFTDVRAARL
jgi:pSer/pThr/pTyr-binding forkhead associated (FHA) protein